MGLTYNKQFTPKDRRIVTSGPADRQRKQKMESTGSSAETVSVLKAQVESLMKQLAEKPAGGGYTPEQVDEEIVKAIKVETAELTTKHTQELATLEKKNSGLAQEIKSLKDTIKNKEEMIQELRESKTSGGVSEEQIANLINEATKKLEGAALASQGLSQADVDPNRPKMETVFVDPIEKESKVEKHFEVDVEVGDESIAKKEKMTDQVNKLKSLLGKMPDKRG